MNDSIEILGVCVCVQAAKEAELASEVQVEQQSTQAAVVHEDNEWGV